MLFHTNIGEGCSAAVWQVETRKRMQAEYERKMTAMRADTAQKQADEAKRLQQRSAAISRLHTATEVRPGRLSLTMSVAPSISRPTSSFISG